MSGVATITIDRPECRNALDVDSCLRLTSELHQAVETGSRAIVLAGAGPHFCAGADLGSVQGGGLMAALRTLLDTICGVPVAVIAAVQGAALGAGTQLAVACDLRVVAPDARFGIPAAKLGLTVDQPTVRRLALLAGHGPARAMLLAAEEMDAETALRLGFAQRGGDLAAAQAWAEQLAALAPLTIAAHKLALNQLETGVPADAEVAAARQRAWASPDAVEGLAAFRERRPPQFEGQ